MVVFNLKTDQNLDINMTRISLISNMFKMLLFRKLIWWKRLPNRQISEREIEHNERVYNNSGNETH